MHRLCPPETDGQQEISWLSITNERRRRVPSRKKGRATKSLSSHVLMMIRFTTSKGSAYSRHQPDSIRFESFFLEILPSLPRVSWPPRLQAVRPAIAPVDGTAAPDEDEDTQLMGVSSEKAKNQKKTEEFPSETGSCLSRLVWVLRRGFEALGSGLRPRRQHSLIVSEEDDAAVRCTVFRRPG
jgi:hypothetical protein